MKRRLKTLWAANAADPLDRPRLRTCPNPPRGCRKRGLPFVRSGGKTYRPGWIV